MKLTMLGSGDAFCDWRANYENNAVVHTADGLVLIDCGMTAVQSMRELGWGPADVHALVLTHIHPDHSSAAALMQERFYRGNGGAPSWSSTRVIAPADVQDPFRVSMAPFFDDAQSPPDDPRQDGIDAVLAPQPTDLVRFGGLQIRFFRVPHVTGIATRTGLPFDKPTYGLELEEDGRKVVWSSDTIFRRDWIEETARDPAVVCIFHDCTFEPWYARTVHTHFTQLETLASHVKAKLVLMHHVQVPDDIDVSAYADAAERHQVFEL